MQRLDEDVVWENCLWIMREEAIEHSGGIISVGLGNGVQVETFSSVMIDSLKNRNRFEFHTYVRSSFSILYLSGINHTASDLQVAASRCERLL